MTKKEIIALVDEEIGSRPEAAVDFLYAVALACQETAQHLAENWQDREMAKRWEKCASQVEKAVHFVDENIPV